MLKRIIIVVAVLILGFTLASCGNSSSSSSELQDVSSFSNETSRSQESSESQKSSESSESNESSESIESNESIESSESNESSEPSSPEPVAVEKSVKEVNDMASTVVEDSEYGYGNSSDLISVEVKVVTSFNVIRNGSNYDGNFMMLAGDTTGTIYLRLPYTIDYKKMNYMGNAYKITGYPSKYYGVNQIFIVSYERIFTDINLSLESKITEVTSLASVHEQFKNLAVNVKGCNGGDIVKVKGTVIDNPDKNLLYIYDGTTAIKLHKNSDVDFGAFVGGTYTFYAHLNMYQYSPSLQFIKIGEAIEETFTIDSSNNQLLTAEELYKTSREANEADKNYTSLFSQVYTFTGYVSMYLKGQNYFMVLTDEYRENDYSTYTSARDGKALFVRNLSEREINKENELVNSKLFEMREEKITVSFMLQEYNSLGYWTVELDLTTLKLA